MGEDDSSRDTRTIGVLKALQPFLNRLKAFRNGSAPSDASEELPVQASINGAQIEAPLDGAEDNAPSENDASPADNASSENDAPIKTGASANNFSLLDRYFAWIGFTVVVGLAPFIFASAAVPPGHRWREIFLRGDIFIFLIVVLGASVTDLLFSRTAKRRSRVSLLFASGLLGFASVFMYVFAATNEIAASINPPPPVRGEGQTGPFTQITHKFVVKISFFFGLIGLLISGTAVWVAHGNSKRQGS